jgi:hypothetical protein
MTMKKTISFLSLIAITLVLSVGCAQRGDETGDDDPMPDAGPGDLTIDPPAESTSWPCRSGVDAEGDSYLEFRAGYLNNGAEATAYIVGDASGEGIVGYFTGSYVTVDKDGGWYRYYLTGPEGSEWVLTYGRCVDTAGNNASCWAQYGSNLAASSAGPFRWNSGGTNYACKGKVGAAGKPAVPHGG